MMNSRESILSRLQTQERAATYPPQWQTRRRFDDLIERFSNSLTASKGEVHHASNLEKGLTLLGELLAQLKAQKIVVNSELPLNAFDFPARWPDITWHIVGETAGDLRAFCIDADVGLSGTDAALAETGSIVISSGPGKSRLATLLPPVHLALIPMSRLTVDIFTWTAARSEPPPANIIIVSGPSKTADIEQTMATGVHGPKRFIVILYEE